MVRADVTNMKPEELLHALCTEIRVLSRNMQAACELLLTGEHALLSEEQKELVTLINRGTLGLEELEQLILDYLRYIRFLPTLDFPEGQSASQPDNEL